MKKLFNFLLLSSVSLILLIVPPITLAQGPGAGQFYIFGNAYTGDGLAPGWKNLSAFNGVNNWNIIETQQIYAGVRAVSWSPAGPFEKGSLVGTTPINLSQYQYLYFYGRSTEAGQRLQIGLCDQNGNTIGQMVPFESAGQPLQPDRWALYNIPISQFGAGTTPVYGIVFQDMNGAPQKKIFMDEIVLSPTAGIAPVISSSLSQPGTPIPPPPPKAPYYPQISPWVFIIPGIIIMTAIFFE